MWKGPAYDCQQCGACCTNGADAGTDYVYLRKDEARRMRRLGLSVVQSSGASYLGLRARGEGPPACVAFRGDVGGPCGCSIYEERPEKCRSFAVGDFFCRQARAEAGLPL